MAEQKVHFKIFFAAPDELADERSATTDLVAEWNREPGTTLGVWLELLHWRSDATPETGERGQSVIHRQLLDSSDIVLGVFWTWFGRGTEEEIRRGIAQRKKVMIYFSDRPAPPSRVDPAHLSAVTKFKTEFREKSLYWEYRSLPEFVGFLRQHLTSIVRSLRTQMLPDGIEMQHSAFASLLSLFGLRPTDTRSATTSKQEPAKKTDRERHLREVRDLKSRVAQPAAEAVTNGSPRRAPRRNRSAEAPSCGGYHRMILAPGVEVAERFAYPIFLHVVKHALNTPLIQQPRILAIHGPSGEGKTYQCEAVFRFLDLKVWRLSGHEFESPRSGEPGRVLARRYVDACEAIARRDTVTAVLFINDIDAGIGNCGNRVQYTVNTQTLNATLMELADHSVLTRPEHPLAPIVVTGNDLTRLYQPLARLGRMTFLEWRATSDEKLQMIHELFAGWHLSDGDLTNLLSEYKDQPIAFFAQIKTRLHDAWIVEMLKNMGPVEMLYRVRNKDGPKITRLRVGIDDIVKVAQHLHQETLVRSHLLPSGSTGVNND